ncbi:MAG: hypothetical protein CL454_04210 [Acidimicrobiaceae bacterium]|nr:hypothetical protein [Acidimicrobiaceae bacterium]
MNQTRDHLVKVQLLHLKMAPPLGLSTLLKEKLQQRFTIQKSPHFTAERKQMFGLQILKRQRMQGLDSQIVCKKVQKKLQKRVKWNNMMMVTTRRMHNGSKS